jgi:hypothetical protein
MKTKTYRTTKEPKNKTLQLRVTDEELQKIRTAMSNGIITPSDIVELIKAQVTRRNNRLKNMLEDSPLSIANKEATE